MSAAYMFYILTQSVKGLIHIYITDFGVCRVIGSKHIANSSAPSAVVN